MNKSKLFPILLFAYVLSLAFQDFMRFSAVFRKVQLPELLFLGLVATFPWNYLKQYCIERTDRVLMSVLSIYWSTNVISSLLSGKISSIVDAGARLYLIFLFGMAVLYFAQLSKIELRRNVIIASMTLGCLLALTGITGTFSSLAGFPSIMADESLNYPYLGTVFRAQGFTHTPAMMVSIFSIIAIVAIAEADVWISKKTRIFIFALMLFTTLLTLSRSMVLVFWGVGLLVYIQKKGFSSKMFTFSAVITALIMTIGTHFIFISKDDPKLPSLLKSQFISNRILFEQGDFQVLETCYLSMKYAALVMASEKPLFGIGTGNFVNGINHLKTTGQYPQKLPSFVAHSSYLSTLAENGLFATLALLAFLGLLWQRIYNVENLKTDNFLVALLLCMTVVFIENIALDTMNFRHYWLLYALVWAYPKISKQDEVLNA